MIDPRFFISRAPPNPSLPATAPIPCAIYPGSATISHQQPPAFSWNYHRTHPIATSKVFQSLPRQREGYGAGRRGRKGGLRRGQHRGPNDFYVGRVSHSLTGRKPVDLLDPHIDQDQWCSTAPKSPLDFYLPKVVQTSPTGIFDRRGQSETCTTWRGLSPEGAEELFTWANIYHAITRQRNECLGRSSIVDEMLEQYEQRPPMGLNWFLSAPNIHQRVERFLSISMVTPRLQTEELQRPIVGQQYILAPHLVDISNSVVGDLAREVVFSTCENWLAFDDSCNVFSGIVPITPPRTIIVKAKIIEYLDERVRLEHIVRARVDLKARAAICAETYLSEIFNDPLLNRKIIHENEKLRKQVSFADEDEPSSLHSSPDHLRSFFNELSAMTVDPSYENTKGHTLPTQPVPKATLSAPDSIADRNSMAEAKVAMEKSKENITRYVSYGMTLDVSDTPNRRRFDGTDSLVQLYPDLFEARLGQTALVPEQAFLTPGDDGDPSGRAADSDAAKICTRHACCADHRKRGSHQDKPFSLYDADTNVDFELALGLCHPDHKAVNDAPGPFPSTPLVFENRFESLSRCSNMDPSTQTFDSLPEGQAELLSDHREAPRYHVFEHTDKSENVSNSEDVLKNLYQWNWKGWEREIDIRRRSCNKIAIPCTSRKNSRPVDSEIEEGPGRESSYREVSQNDISFDTKNDGATAREQSLDLHQYLPIPTLSASITIQGSRSPSEESYSMADQVPNRIKATDSTERSETLYDTVRNQFYKDHKSRQTSSPRRPKSSSGRETLSSVFPSMPDLLDLTHIDRDDAKEISPACSTRQRNTDGIGSCFQVDGTTASSPSRALAEESKPDIASIATAVKNSLAAEVLEEDERERAEIRKGILHHQVMDMSRNEQRRDAGSSNYDDIFWSSDEGSAHD
jgi:hypothetical protein